MELNFKFISRGVSVAASQGEATVMVIKDIYCCIISYID